MARQYAQLNLSIWDDDDWLDLTPGAQHLYVTLLAHPTLSFAGVADWRPGRLMAMSKRWGTEAFYKAAFELSDAHYIVIDTLTEEVLLRSFLRHDKVLKQPRLAVSVTKAFSQIASRKLRQSVVFELRRLMTEPGTVGLPCWNDERMLNLLAQEAVDSRTISTDFDVTFDADFGVGLGQTTTNVSGSPTPSPTPTPGNLHPDSKHSRDLSTVEGGDDW